MQCEVINRLYYAFNSIKKRQKAPRSLRGISTLSGADIEFIDVLYSNPNQNATSLSHILKLSRGAVTQSVNRLEDMGVVMRLPVKGNRKEKLICLTDLGKEIKTEKDKEHRFANAEMCRFLGSLEAVELNAIMQFLNKVSSLDISPFICLQCYCAINAEGECDA
jgi:DNA-binding MarR family transcriptional regulator